MNNKCPTREQKEVFASCFVRSKTAYFFLSMECGVEMIPYNGVIGDTMVAMA